MRELIALLNENGIKTLGCCCGHGRYPKTIVVLHKPTRRPLEVVSGLFIDRKCRFYIKDKAGYFFIPETLKKL